MEKKSVKQLMREAYLRLLSKYKYSDITVSSVVKEAQVGRASFYRNYATTNDILEDILKQYEGEIIKTGIPLLLENREEDQRQFCKQLVHAVKHGNLLAYQPLPENIDYIFLCLKRKYDLNRLQKFMDTKKKYMIISNLSTVYACIKLWAEMGYKETEEELVNIICELLN
ncbi:MAG: TetR/AcrR family transcriptional regulator [Holdemanella sp.]|nr:TetR/AcrR family transcriptional regulator [Holdemanella sp.]